MIGEICYELLSGKNFVTLNINNNGDYYLPKDLSKETISFINDTLQYEEDKRLNAEELYNHDFLTKPYSEFTKINFNEIPNLLEDSKIRMNIYNNEHLSYILKTKKKEEKLNLILNDSINVKNEKTMIIQYEIKIKELEKQINNLNLQLDDKIKNNMYLMKINSHLKEEIDLQKNEREKILKEYNEISDNYKKEKLKYIDYIKKQQIDFNKKIEDLKEIISRYPVELSKGEKLISVLFQSFDNNIYYSIICKNTDIFKKLEDKLYFDYPEYSKNGNFFTVNGNRVIQDKNLDENNIHNNDIIILNNKK